MPEASSRRIFVVGEHGQVALALGRELAARGFAVRLAGRASADITDAAAIAEAVSSFAPDALVNAGAYTAVDKAEEEPDRAFAVNRDGAENVAVAAAAAGVPLIHISTDYVYDGTKPSPYVETDAPNPLGAYGASKLAGEAAVVRIGGEHVILRTSWVCSPDGNNFVRTMLRLAGQREEVGVVDDQWGAPTFAADLAAAVVTIAEVLSSSNDRSRLTGIYHVAGTGYTTWCGFAQAIMETSVKRGGPSCRVRAITTADYPTRARRPENSRLDCTKIARVFGIHLPPWQTSLAVCLDQLIALSQRA
jgi:dTDP-4-dehydrorhamnose reductase